HPRDQRRLAGASLLSQPARLGGVRAVGSSPAGGKRVRRTRLRRSVATDRRFLSNALGSKSPWDWRHQGTARCPMVASDPLHHPRLAPWTARGAGAAPTTPTRTSDLAPKRFMRLRRTSVGKEKNHSAILTTESSEEYQR